MPQPTVVSFEERDYAVAADGGARGTRATSALNEADYVPIPHTAALTNGERSSIREFFDIYRAAFEAFDAAAIANLFAYPCQITGGGPEIAITTIPDRGVWIPQIQQLLAAYRAIGVRSAQPEELQVVELTPGLAQATIHWGLRDQEERTIYDFDATYTLADFGQGMRITAIAHNETPRLRAAIGRQRGH